MNSSGLFQTDSPVPLAPWQWAISSQLSYAYNPVIWRYSDNSFDPVVAHQGLLDLSFNLGLLPILDVAVGLPVVLRQGGGVPGPDGDVGGTGIADTRLSVRVAPVPERIFGFAAAGILELTLPTGNPQMYLGDRAVGVHPRLVASVPLGDISVMGNLGFFWRPKSGTLADVAWGDTLDWRIGARKPFFVSKHALGASLELSGRGPVQNPGAAGTTGLEILAGVTSRWLEAWNISLAVGKGVGAAVGLPAFRVLVGVAYQPSAKDSDNDGIPDSADACPNAAEDYNGYADLDGCPDAHEAPALPPPPLAEPAAPASGADRDHDGIPDAEDSCPDTPEDRDGVLDADGCPDYDNDRDGIPDDQDKCPNQEETINGVDDADGCPDVGQGATVFKPGEGIAIKVAVQFETGRAVIKQESYPVLDEVALQLLAHAEVTLVRVEGHTDSVGAAAGNLRLSQARAESVRNYLIERGVGGERLQAEGFGETQPIDTNDTSEGRANNRRVGFVILQTALFP